MQRIKDRPKHLRPREKLIHLGPANLKDSELLAILLRTGRNGLSVLDLAQKILSSISLDKFEKLKFLDLIAIKGVGADKACSILAAIEIGRRLSVLSQENLGLINTPEKVVAQLNFIRHKKKEYFVCLYLNARNQLIHKETISIGTLDSSLVHPREVFAPAIVHSTASIVLAHNHPSDDVSPSSADRLLTQRLVQASQILGVEIIDHIIVSATKWYSFREHGEMKQDNLE